VSGRSKSSGRWLQEHFSDPFVKRAKSQGFRSRAVFKLEEIDRRENLLRQGQVCLDLGAAPGAWSQYAQQRVGRAGRVIATDILELAPLAGVEFVQGDFREPEVFDAVLARCPPRGVDVVLSDMAPNLSGVDAIDQPRSTYLSELALEELVRGARLQFGTVKLMKPQASRSRSPELYLLAKAFVMV
jgi:23S rRNA (uridine2552-2'-O)-methyltransferase